MTTGQSGRLKKRFLAHFREFGNVTAACRAAGIKRRGTIYEWQEHDEAFATAFREAELEATDLLEAEARRRAVEGVRTEMPVLYRGRVIQTVIETKYSDTLLIFLLKARAPERFRDNVRLEHTGANGGPIRTAEENPVARLSTDEIRRILGR